MFEGATHADIVDRLAKQFGDDIYKAIEDGFVTTHGRFVDRAEANQIALEQGQHLKPNVVPDLFGAEDLKPPQPPGTIRVYHGGPPEGGEPPTTGGSRWVSTNLEYARGFRAEEGRHGQVWYVDLPEDYPDLKPEYPEQGPKQGFTFNFDMPEDLAKKMKPLGGDGLAAEPPEPPPTGGEPPPEEPSSKRIFSRAKAIGRTEKEYTAYEKLIAQRDAEDVEWRLRRAEKEANLVNSKAWKDEASSIRSEVRDEISSRPEIAAYRFFQDGVTPWGNKLARKPKINEQSLTPEQKAAFPKQFIAPRGRGYDPDAVANLFGLSDGDSAIAAISALEREATAGRGDIVDRLVDAEVSRRVDAKLGESAKERLDEAYDHALSVTQLE